jgi:hypothetical protein
MLISRLNTKLESRGLEPMSSLGKDFSDGVKLIQVGGHLDVLTRANMRSFSYVAGMATTTAGTLLITSQEIMSDTTLGRYTLKPKMRVQKAEVSTELSVDADR